MLTTMFLLASCAGNQTEKTSAAPDSAPADFEYKVDRFADIEILR